MKKFKSIKGIVDSQKPVFVKDKDGREHKVTIEDNDNFITIFVDGNKDCDIFMKGKDVYNSVNIFNKNWLIRECYTL